jgi:hypothetical protein
MRFQKLPIGFPLAAKLRPATPGLGPYEDRFIEALRGRSYAGLGGLLPCDAYALLAVRLSWDVGMILSFAPKSKYATVHEHLAAWYTA